ncbi:MAG: protein tyrosine phosphatase family protein [Gemmatimonadota bacterium]
MQLLIRSAIRSAIEAMGRLGLSACLLASIPVGGVLAQQPAPAPLATVRNFQIVSERLASSGQIGYDQIPLIREAGYQVIINLAVADEERNGREGFLVAQEGLTYVHIPVVWDEPEIADVRMFFDVMRANRDRKVYVHCFANMRASAFVYLCRTLVEGMPEAEARATMNAVWDPRENDAWARLLERARTELGQAG